MKNRVLPLLMLAALCVSDLTGCRYELDRLYALPLDEAPTGEDWRRLPPFRVEAVGGSTTVARESEVDSDAVHVTTASCHHGAEMPPVAVDLQAFWTEEYLYLRVAWTDPTENRGPVWSWTGAEWIAASRWEDGLGLLWGAQGEEFHCSRYCHLDDWRVAGERSFADFAMMTPIGVDLRDFWVWRPGRGSVQGSVEDSGLGPGGRYGDGGGPEETYTPNSVRAEGATAGVGVGVGAGVSAGVFGAGDAPRVFPAPQPGARAPAYLSRAVPAGRSEVEVSSRWEDGRWSVVLRRSLAGADPGDVRFRAGDEIPFGLAILDAVERDHLAVAEPIRVRLVSRDELSRTLGSDTQ